ncbi:MAG: YetF domain-containing protein, partial [Methanosarcina sp.]
VLGIAGYIALIFFLRVSGKRTLSKLNAFDFVITVALGSTFGSFILSKDISLSEGLTGLAVLIWLQHMISWLTVRSDFIKGVVRGEPTLVYYNGEYLKDAMKRSRVVESEIEQSVRNEGHANLEDVGAVILETDGSFSIIGRSEKEGKELNIAGLKV